MSTSQMPPPQPPYVAALIKLRDLQQQALKLREAMDFCADHCRMEDLILNPPLRMEAVIQYAKRNNVSMDAARLEVERKFDILKAKNLSLINTDQPAQE